MSTPTARVAPLFLHYLPTLSFSLSHMHHQLSSRSGDLPRRSSVHCFGRPEHVGCRRQKTPLDNAHITHNQQMLSLIFVFSVETQGMHHHNHAAAPLDHRAPSLPSVAPTVSVPGLGVGGLLYRSIFAHRFGCPARPLVLGLA